MKQGLILMTALVPTVGHEYLIKFASEFMMFDPDYELTVVISTRSGEPTSFAERVAGLNHLDAWFVEHRDDNAPQNPPEGDQTEFWNYWKDTILGFVDNVDFVFASEPYGAKVAEILGAEFIPVDMAREIVPVKGTTVRQDLFGEQHLVTSGFRRKFKQDVVLFGPESCGKTTMARKLADRFNGRFVHEWARPYLETVGPEITDEKMLTIVRGQTAVEMVPGNTFFTFYDTDLLTTLGFYELYEMEPPLDLKVAIATATPRFYIVMNDQIPFEEDPLRYGGTERESDVDYWIKLLKKYGPHCYYVVKNTDLEEQLEEISAVLLNSCPFTTSHTYQDIIDFVRD